MKWGGGNPVCSVIVVLSLFLDHETALLPRYANSDILLLFKVTVRSPQACSFVSTLELGRCPAVHHTIVAAP